MYEMTMGLWFNDETEEEESAVFTLVSGIWAILWNLFNGALILDQLYEWTLTKFPVSGSREEIGAHESSMTMYAITDGSRLTQGIAIKSLFYPYSCLLKTLQVAMLITQLSQILFWLLVSNYSVAFFSLNLPDSKEPFTLVLKNVGPLVLKKCWPWEAWKPWSRCFIRMRRRVLKRSVMSLRENWGVKVTGILTKNFPCL